MITDRIDPPGLAMIPGSANVVVATGAKLVAVSGQTGVDEDGKVVGTTHLDQSRQALNNLRLRDGGRGAARRRRPAHDLRRRLQRCRARGDHDRGDRGVRRGLPDHRRARSSASPRCGSPTSLEIDAIGDRVTRDDPRHPLVAENAVVGGRRRLDVPAADRHGHVPADRRRALDRQLGGRAGGDGEGDQPSLRDPRRRGRVAPRRAAGRTGRGRQHRRRVQPRHRRGRGRARAQQRSRESLARRAPSSGAHGAAHRRRAAARRVQLLRADRHPHRSAARARARRAGDRVARHARPRGGWAAGRRVVARPRATG